MSDGNRHLFGPENTWVICYTCEPEVCGLEVSGTIICSKLWLLVFILREGSSISCKELLRSDVATLIFDCINLK